MMVGLGYGYDDHCELLYVPNVLKLPICQHLNLRIAL